VNNNICDPGLELVPVSEPGERFAKLAQSHAVVFAERADKHDREGSFPFINFEELRSSGFMGASVPEPLGGLGLKSVHDLMVGMSRLSRGDASTAIAASMHITGAAIVSRMMEHTRAAGEDAASAALENLLKRIASGAATLCFPNTEAGTDLASPTTELTPAEGGYHLNGRKIFATLAPAANLFFPSARISDGAGGYRTASVMVERGTPGFEIGTNWNALGMRASGSCDLTFKNCFISKSRLFNLRNNYGQSERSFTDYALIANLPLIASFLGIAEAARDFTIQTMTSRRKGPGGGLLAERPSIQHLVAEIELEIAVCRAITNRLGQLADQFLERTIGREASAAELNSLGKEVQCMKFVVNRKTIQVVDQAMIACGGAAYMNGHLLSRLYRDARAGPFMQPFAPHDAIEYIGKTALGLTREQSNEPLRFRAIFEFDCKTQRLV
jgi:alkylation response protein AidB-like acyl-CoA dehydrogenase